MPSFLSAALGLEGFRGKIFIKDFPVISNLKLRLQATGFTGNSGTFRPMRSLSGLGTMLMLVNDAIVNGWIGIEQVWPTQTGQWEKTAAGRCWS